MTVGPTKHFKNCLGVFQGGGCKALAFVGAYGEAFDRGVFFSGVCGTSAGSILASLVAAGATPKQLAEIVAAVDFNKFKKPAEPKLFRFKKNTKMRVAECFEKGRALMRLGFYSSEYLENWIDDQLRVLLGKPTAGKITFADLNIPLYVVATQLGSSTPKIWSVYDTPHDSVAFAVRCSCSIPIFFQPVNGTYVDGGVISNLPAFVSASDRHGAFEKILCFAFDSEVSVAQPSRSPPRIELSPEKYLLELASAAVDGAVTIQNGLQPNLHTIAMGPLPLGTVDFDKVNNSTVAQMFEAGRLAARRFFDAEALNVKSTVGARRILVTEAEALNEIARYEVTAEHEIILLRGSNRWVYNLFPTLYYWTQHSAKLTFMRSSAVAPHHVQQERFRDLVLAGLGAEVRVTPDLPFEGVLLLCGGVVERAIIFINSSRTVSPGYAVTYDGEWDRTALDLLRARANEKISDAEMISASHDALIEPFEHSTEELFRRLKAVRQYSGSAVTFSIEDVDSSRIVFLTRYVKSYKYTQIRHIFNMARSAGKTVGDDLWLDYVTADGRSFKMPVTPPIVEQHGDYFVLIEGNSRVAYTLKDLRQSTVRAVVVKGVSDPLPATAQFSARQVLVSDEDRIGDTRYEGFNYQLYREIEASARPLRLYLGD